MADHDSPDARPTTRRLRPGPFLFIGILFIGCGLTAIGYTAWPAYGFLQEGLAGHGAEASWSMTLGMILGLIAFVGGVLCLGGTFLIRTHLRESNPR